MKKYFYNLFAGVLVLTLFWACTEDMGTTPGSDSQATVTLYKYAAEAPYDGDCDVMVRVAANSATTEAYALAETRADKEKRIAEIGSDGYNNYVVEHGEKLSEINGVSIQDKIFTNLKGENVITVVAVGGGNKKAAEVEFTGITWTTVTSGTYIFGVKNIQSIYANSIETSLQYCDSDPSSYRFKNLFGEGKHLKFTTTTYQYSDGATVCRVAAQTTPLTFGDYGTVSVRDVATWQNDDAYLDCALYDDGYVYLWVQYYVEAGNLGYGYDEFYPNE